MKKSTIYALAIVLTAAIACEKEDDGKDPNPSTSKNFTVTITNEFSPKAYFQSGIFNTPEGASMPGPIGPGAMFGGTEYKFSFQAGKEHKLSLVTMFIQSNDWILSTNEQGIALYDGSGNPIGASGAADVTAQIGLYDAGTEEDEVPGVGMNQAPRQSGPNTGPADANVNVRSVTMAGLPTVADVIQVLVEYKGSSTFEATIKAASTASTLMTPGGSVPVPLSPGAYAIHSGVNAFFTLGSPASNGLEEIAEDGNPAVFKTYADGETGYVSPFAPGVYAIHNSSAEAFTAGEVAPAGLEALAEDASPGDYKATLDATAGVSAAGIFNDPNNSGTMGPIMPGSSYTFSFDAEEGDYLSFASMLGNTNDLFIAPDGGGIALFSNGIAISGDITGQVMLWDAGSEVNEYPGAGPNQAPRQPGPNSGADENGTVELIDNVNDGFSYPSVASMVSITIQAN